MRKIVTLSLVPAFVLASAVAFAAPSGFDSTSAIPQGPQGFANASPNTVAQVLANGRDDQVVTLTGSLTNYLGDDRYEFTDVAGDRIEVELDDDRNWSHIGKDMPIRITGEIDKDLLSTSLDVFDATPLTK